MPEKCEDYPCCGHEEGECPNKDGSFNCYNCGKKLPIDTSSNFCRKCSDRVRDEISESNYYRFNDCDYDN